MAVPRFKIGMSIPELLAWFGKLTETGKSSEVEEFERLIAAKVQRKFAISFPSGRIALYALLKALSKESDKREIVIPAFTVPEVITMIRAAGWKPIFADAHEKLYNVQPFEVEDKISSDTGAVLMTHLFGQPCDAFAFDELARKRGLILLEDAAQALGSHCDEKPVGSFGKASLLSFGLVKNLTTLGGGMIVCDDERLADELHRFRSGFADTKFTSLAKRLSLAAAVNIATSWPVFPLATYPTLRLLDISGSDLADRMFDEKPDELSLKDIPESMLKKFSPVQAAWGKLQLDKLEDKNKRRRENAFYLRALLVGTTGLGLPQFQQECVGIHLNFAVRHAQADQLVKLLRRYGVDTTKGYLANCADSRYFPEYKSDCPIAAKLERELLYLPIYPSLNERDMECVAKAVKKACDELA